MGAKATSFFSLPRASFLERLFGQKVLGGLGLKGVFQFGYSWGRVKGPGFKTVLKSKSGVGQITLANPPEPGGRGVFGGTKR